MKVLIVEDDENLSKALAYILEENNYKVSLAFNGEDGYHLALNENFDVIVTDRMMPKMDGATMCAKLRQRNINTPIIMLTALESVDNKIEGLDSGADDYMTKPFAPQELLAHLNALTRRKGGVVYTNLQFSDLELHTNPKVLRCNEQTIKLDKQEYVILKLFLESDDNKISKNEIISNVWGENSIVGENNVDTYITFIQKKLNYFNSKCTIQKDVNDTYKLIEH